jgi:4-amino-4-deoxy-L-arabinose transferase-like glycosyltransferase
LSPRYKPRLSSQAIISFIDAHTFTILAGIATLAIVLNIAILIDQPPIFNYGETGHWWPLIQNLVNGHGYVLCEPEYFPFCNPSNEITATREPVPVLFFTAIAWLSNQSLLVAAVFEAGIHLAILFIVFLLARSLANTRAALLASLLWTVYLPGLELVPQVSGDLLACLFLALGIFFIMRSRQTGRWRDWLIAGAAFGLAALSRTVVLAVLLPLVIGLVWEGWAAAGKKWSGVIRRMWPSLVIVVIVVIMMAPWIIRNQLAFRTPVIGTTLSGYNLYRHNHIIDRANDFRYVTGEEAQQAVQDLLVRQTNLTGTENEAQMDKVYLGAALKLITAYPLRYLELSLWRFLPLWFDWQINEAYGVRTPHLDYYEMIVQGLFLVLALVATWKTWKNSWPLWSSIVIYSLAYMAVVGQLRYIVGVMPLVLALSAAGCQHLTRKK